MDPTSDKPLPTICILAPGLLGASLAAASKKKRICGRVHIWARREETRNECAQKAWCDQVFDLAEDAVAEADVVWICSPVGSIAKLVGQVARSLKAGAIVSDVGSTKGKVVEQCEQAIAGKGMFVGSHPMAGSEKSGTVHASADLFEGKPCFVTTAARTDSAAAEGIVAYWKALGMSVHQVSPREHDRIVACISHLPHIVAATLSSKVAELGGEAWKEFISTGFSDTTRVAAGSVGMWMDIIQHNRSEILPALGQMIDGLEHLKVHLQNGQFEAVEKVLIQGKEFRESI